MATVTQPVTVPTAAPLTLMDRCDRCSSRAYVRATMPTGTELLFCGHHATEHRPALLGAGASFHDETDKLTIARESGFG